MSTSLCSHTGCSHRAWCPLHPAGLPNDNDTVYCPVNQTTCYWQQTGSFTYQQAQTRCASLGGYVTSWNEGPEQLQIENYFRVRVCAATTWFPRYGGCKWC
jgi:hypothetical protein